jgi:DNA polymerase III sliding clamp (beta) subunit (PCNA family)
MLKELKFVQGAVAKKDLVPALTHFVIENGNVRGFNGTLALCAPIKLDIACKPKAAPLVEAISKCEDTVQLSLTPTGRLSIKSGAFKCTVLCTPEEKTAHPEPEGERVELDGAALLAALKAIAPFIGDDASRPWSNGVLLRDQSAFATNNVCLVEYWIGSAFPHVVNVPRAAVKEMLRVDEAPLYAQMVEGSSITFHYSDGRWIRTQLMTTEWPDLAKVLNRESVQAPVDGDLFRGLKAVKGFVDKQNRIYFRNGYISTHVDENEATTYDVAGVAHDGIYAHEMLSLLEGVAVSCDFSAYPAPCIFMGERLRGAIVGMRL